MKKIILIVLDIILISIICIILINNITLGNMKIESISDIKNSKKKLDKEVSNITVLSSKTYPQQVEQLKEAIKKLQQQKENYDTKTSYSEISDINKVEVQTYEIEFLWTKLGNYATDRNLILTLDVAVGNGTDNYNLNFTAKGNYIGITNFIYDIENDSKLNFKVENLKIEKTPKTTNTNSNTAGNNKSENNNTTKNEISEEEKAALNATFSVNDISIKLD